MHCNVLSKEWNGAEQGGGGTVPRMIAKAHAGFSPMVGEELLHLSSGNLEVELGVV